MEEYMQMLRACDAHWVPRDEQRLATGVSAALADMHAVRMLSDGATIPEAISSLRVHPSSSAVGDASGDLGALESHGAWERIAAAFVPSHTAAECRVAWGRRTAAANTPQNAPPSSADAPNGKIRTEKTKGAWSAGEDVALARAINTHWAQNGAHAPVDWRDVAAHVRTRSAAQCAMRWLKSLDPRVRTAPWSPAEDAVLCAAAARVPLAAAGAWRRVAAWVSALGDPERRTHRTDVQCRERWAAVSGNVRSGAWAADEDARLVAAVARLGTGRWAAVARSVGTRSDSQCRRRHAHLHPS